MRIVSLVPHATELLFALGLGEQVVGVTHECDHPTAAAALPHVTRDVLPEGLSAAEIDREVSERTQRGEAIYALDEKAVRALKPDLIVTQELCPVCAVSYDEVAAMAKSLPSCPKVVALDPKTFGETLGDAKTIAQLTGTREAAIELVKRTRARVDAVRLTLRDAGRRAVPVVAIEWFDPVYVAGHWTPQLVEYAGGFDLLGLPGEHSQRVAWEEVAAAAPEVIVAMPCGWYLDDSRAQTLAHWKRLESLGAQRIYAVDAASTFSRPGPRLVDGVELLAHLFHPDLADPPGEIGFAEVTAGLRADP